MSRKLLLFSLLFGLSASAQGSNSPPPATSDTPSQDSATSDVIEDSGTPVFHHKTGRTPFWLPRGAFLGTYIRHGAITPQPRLQWEFTFFEDRKDSLVALVEGGIGYAVVRPDTALEGYDVPVYTFYEHTAMVGLGYRNDSPDGLHWGFQVTGGPFWYGAHLGNLDNEHYTVGLVEGRIQIGHTVGPLVLGVSGGIGEPFSFSKHSVARFMAGGVLLGLFADWR